MSTWFRPRLRAIKVFAVITGLLAPVPTRAVLTLGNATHDMVVTSSDKMTPVTTEHNSTGTSTSTSGTITPPLTRPPSLESNTGTGTSPILPGPWDQDETITIILQARHILDFNVPSPPPHTAYDSNENAPPWLPEIVAALMLAINFLLAPLGDRERCRAGCRRGNANHDSGDPRDPPPRSSSLWKDVKDAAGRMLDIARSGLRAVADRIGDFFDDPDARSKRLVKLASAFQVRDLSPRHGHRRHDSGQLIEVDRMRLSAGKDVSAGVQMVCRQACAMFPEVGYNQGFDAACKAIFVSVGQNAVATLDIFTKWAVPVAWLLFNEYVAGENAAKPAVKYTWFIIQTRAAPVFGWLSRDPVVGRHNPDEMLESILEHVFFESLITFCTRLGLNKSVMNDIIEETMKAGVHGPGVSLYVVMCLLCKAERDGAERVDEIMMIKVHLKAAASKTRSLKDLQKEAPVTLEDFVKGYRDAMFGIPAAEDLTE